MAAANVAGVDLVYHAVDASGVSQVRSGLQLLQDIWTPGLSLDAFADRVVMQGFVWGSSHTLLHTDTAPAAYAAK